MTNAHILATAIGRLTGLNPERPVSFDDLVALNVARECVNALFNDCVDELSVDPEAMPLWAAVASAIELSAPTASSKHKAPSSGIAAAGAGARVVKFWDTFAERFAWDFLPTEFLHALYAQWMEARHPMELALPKTTFTRHLKAVLANSDSWFYTRSRPGSLMSADEPLMAHLTSWQHDGSYDAIYGLRRNGA